MQLPPVLAGLGAGRGAGRGDVDLERRADRHSHRVQPGASSRGCGTRDIEAGSEHDHIRNNRLYVFGFGIVMVVIACVLQDVVTALTVAYDILVGGLLVPILGGLVWRRGTNVGAVAAMAVGTVATLATMFYGDIYANEPIFRGWRRAWWCSWRAACSASRPTPRCWPSGIAAAADRKKHLFRCEQLCGRARMPLR